MRRKRHPPTETASLRLERVGAYSLTTFPQKSTNRVALQVERSLVQSNTTLAHPDEA